MVLDMVEDLLSWLLSVACSLLRWLFTETCSTAAPLLSLSFAINSIFTGLSFSRFNMCEWLKRRALKCIDNSVGDSFLAKVERLGKDNTDICQRLSVFQANVTKYRALMQNGHVTWEWVRRVTTILCAISAFILMAFEVKTRIGVTLVLPYAIILICHALYVWFHARRVLLRYNKLINVMTKAEKESHPEFDIAACINKLKSDHAALSPSPTATYPVSPKSTPQVQAPVRVPRATTQFPTDHPIPTSRPIPAGRKIAAFPKRPIPPPPPAMA